jgi:hypothetical protein
LNKISIISAPSRPAAMPVMTTITQNRGVSMGWQVGFKSRL